MFGFGKKKKKEETAAQGETKEALEAEEHRELREFAADFEPETLDLMALTGPLRFDESRAEGKELWTMTAGLTAWLEEDVEGVHQGSFQLVAMGDEKLKDYLISRVPGDFILKFKGRMEKDGGDRILLAGLPEPGFDAELKALRDEQRKPVTFWLDGLGTFTLVRAVGWFEAEVEWKGQTIQLDMDQDENRADCAETAKALLADQDKWDRSVREFAAKELLDLANQWAAEGGEEGDGDEAPEEITAEQFMERMELESVQVYEDGAFDFWFNGGDLFPGRSIHVSGSLTDGPTEAQMEE